MLHFRRTSRVSLQLVGMARRRAVADRRAEHETLGGRRRDCGHPCGFSPGKQAVSSILCALTDRRKVNGKVKMEVGLRSLFITSLLCIAAQGCKPPKGRQEQSSRVQPCENKGTALGNRSDSGPGNLRKSGVRHVPASQLHAGTDSRRSLTAISAKKPFILSLQDCLRATGGDLTCPFRQGFVLARRHGPSLWMDHLTPEI